MGMGAAAFLYLLLSLWVQDATAADLGFARSDFPREFVFGAGTSAYQYEGAVAEDGRSPSNWDTFTHAGKMADKSTGDVAADGYHKYMEDVKLMSEIGLEAYRFSISWSRLIPNGRGAVNPKGLEYYNNIIDELVNYGIQVHITLHHVDLPQILEDEYGGWLSLKIVEDFTAYADVCFREFGDGVASWTTMDEINIGVVGSYDSALFPPGRCSDPFGVTKCTTGDSSIEPYIAAKNALMAHASVFSLYREKYQHKQKGIVGINIYSYWSYPLTNTTVDLEATQRCKDFLYGWILGPLVFGDYPQVMKNNVGSRLPLFTKIQSELIKGSLDFIGINHYFSVYVNDRPLDTGVRDYKADMSVDARGSRTDPPAGQGPPTNVPSDPKGLQFALEYLKETYGNLPIYVQENGMGSADDSLDDTDRIGYLSSYMESTLKAMRCVETNQERSQREGLLRLGVHGPVRAPVGVPVEVRALPGGLCRREATAASQALGSLVLRLPQAQRNHCAGVESAGEPGAELGVLTPESIATAYACVRLRVLSESVIPDYISTIFLVAVVFSFENHHFQSKL